jgi:hypothetical protein
MITTILLLMGFGLPQHSPKQEASCIVPAGGGRVTFTIDKGAWVRRRAWGRGKS